MLEVNPRARRTVPFVAKTIGQPIAAIAAKVMAGVRAGQTSASADQPYDHIAVKEAVFPFARFPGVDTVLGPEMRSTGEVMGLDWRRAGRGPGAGLRPRLRQEPARRRRRPAGAGCAFVSVKEADKPLIVEPVRLLLGAGFTRHRHRRHLRLPARAGP